MTQGMDDDVSDLRHRIERLEEDNQRLREKLEPLLGGPETPASTRPSSSAYTRASS
jgi:hypothetical protein